MNHPLVSARYLEISIGTLPRFTAMLLIANDDLKTFGHGGLISVERTLPEE
jgi:hypothetical protein